MESPYELEGALEEIAAFYRRLHAAGAVPVSAGGDHSVTLPIFREIAAERPVGMVHFDAHCDTGDDYLGSKFHHGAPFKRAVEEGLLDPKRTSRSASAARSTTPTSGASATNPACAWSIWRSSTSAGPRT